MKSPFYFLGLFVTLSSTMTFASLEIVRDETAIVPTHSILLDKAIEKSVLSEIKGFSKETKHALVTFRCNLDEAMSKDVRVRVCKLDLIRPEPR